MSEEVVIRAFSPEDLEAIYEIERRSFPDPWPKRLFKSYHGSRGVYFLVATLDGKIVGYILGRVERGLGGRLFSTPRMFGHILNIAVSPELRRSGIGTRLMGALESLFGREGVELVWLEVRASNLSAQSFYRGLGYRTRGRVSLYYGDEDGIIMEKDLR
ncbi:MAG: ribosomal protein S18-alanine N-acetyltransferase [Candidatus Bathyarchaeia archaeon]